MPSYNAVVFHGSAVAVKNDAFLFTAKSGTGKTTHTNIWQRIIGDSFMVNGDKPVIRIFDDGIKVCGTPWKGKENLGCDKCVTLKSVCQIIRNETNYIEKVSLSDLSIVLINQTYRPVSSDSLIKTLNIIKQIGAQVKLFRLYCNIQDEAALISYNGMK